MQDNLVIVESPQKATTLAKYLGADFIVKSSRGHVRDLAKKDLGININDGYSPVYEVSSDKGKVVDELIKLSKSVKTVWLASDEDREGEAIAWHLAQVLDLPVDRTKRIVFHEITKQAILKAVENPRTINMNLVNAQQARRVLDRLVGFELSPLLWRKVRPQLSAGRVQSVAVRLIVEREREIIAFDSKQYYRVVAQFQKSGTTAKSTILKADLTRRLESKEQAEALLNDSIGASYSVTKVEEKPLKRKAAAPFTTSTLQQEAGRKLGMSVSQIMSVAQRLYEQGLITYMRTDSVNLSSQALEQCKEMIISEYGAEYSAPTNYKTKSKGAQEAHEAIRPSYIERKSVDGTSAEKRLYDLIWKRTIASQMVPAQLDRTIITIEQDGKDVAFTTTGEVVRFDGFMRLYTEAVEEENATEGQKSVARLPKLIVGDPMNALEITASERYTQSPARFNESSLVKRLEELGIGRPSTYASTITTVITRGYVLKQSRVAVKREYEQLTLKEGVVSSQTLSENVGKEKDSLSPTDIGMLVNDYLESQFAEILDYNFTANVEKEFDRVAEGDIVWNQMIDDFYQPFHSLVDKAIGEQVTRTSHERILGVDPKSGRDVKARIGRYGAMVEIVAPEGEKPKYAGLKPGQLIESITLEEALSLFDLPRTLGEFEGHDLVVGIGRFGPYVRQDKSFTSLAKTDDPYTITLERAIELVVTSREAKAAANTPIKTFAEDAEMVIKSGRYGPYIAYNKKNYRIPKGRAAEELTFEECREIIAKSKK